MLKKIAINTFIVITSITFFFGLGEILARAFFPTFSGQVSNKIFTLGKRIHRAPDNILRKRLPYPDFDDSDLQNKNIILIVGDSISYGYGNAYEDIYWRHWQRRLDLDYENPPTILSVSGFGNNHSDDLSSINNSIKILHNRGNSLIAIIYQFNYNDLIPFGRDDIIEYKHIDARETWLMKIVIPLRMKFLNRSVLQRVASHYIAKLFRNNSKNCRDRGYTAVPEPYAFGAVGFETQSGRAWESLKRGLEQTRNSLGDIPFFILVSPLEFQIDHDQIAHLRRASVLYDCMTIDARAKILEIGLSLGIKVIDPTSYMVAGFKNRLREGNPAPFFFLNDENHINERGSIYFSEFGYSRIIRKIMGK